MAMYAPLVWALTAACVSAQCLHPRDGYDGERLCPDGYDGDGYDGEGLNASRRLANKPPSKSKGKLPMYVKPNFIMWAGLNFAGGFVQGIFATQQAWPVSADSYFSAQDASDIVRVSNLNGDIKGQPILKVGNGYDVKRQFEGDFKQSFDPSCYPYDHQEVKFEIAIDMPVSSYWEMFLVCSDNQTARDSKGNVVSSMRPPFPTTVQSCTSDLGSTAAGMKWDALVCTKSSSSAITCSMTGDRDNSRILTNFLLPSIMVTMMSFFSFLLDISAAMPRIATTMIAMLTLINLRNALAHGIPSSGSLSWIEQHFLTATILMFMNLCFHIAAMGLHKKGYVILSSFLDEFGSGVSFSVSILAPFTLLIIDGCTDQGISTAGVAVVIVFGVLLLGVVILKVFYATHKRRKIKKEKDVEVGQSPNDGSAGRSDGPREGGNVTL